MILLLLPLTHAFLGLVGLAWQRTARYSLLLSCASDAGLVGLLLFARSSSLAGPIVVGGGSGAMAIRLAADEISLVFLLLAVILEIAVVLYLLRARLRPYFYMLVHLLFAASFALVVSRDLFNMYVLLELLTLVSFLLVGYERRPEQMWASLKYLVLASIGMAIFLLGVSVIYRHTGILDLDALTGPIASAAGARWIPIAAALLLGGAGVKAGIFGFSLWLPSAHATAPSAVSALLSGLVIKMGIVLIARLSSVFPISTPLLSLGALTGVIGAGYAVFSTDLKRMLAFHTLSQMGYLLIGAAAAPAGYSFLAYALAHGCFKGLLFLAAGEAGHFVGTTRLDALFAQRKLIPVATRMALLVGTIGIVGVPPFAGYTAKALVAVSSPSPLIHAALAVIGIGTAASFAKLLPLFPPTRPSAGRARAPSSYLVLTVPILAFLPISWGLFGGATISAALTWQQSLQCIAIILAGGAGFRLLRRRPITLPQRIFRIEESVLSILFGFFLIYLLLQHG
jgi:multicomponent Na+:H+ antiporter subunit D